MFNKIFKFLLKLLNITGDCVPVNNQISYTINKGDNSKDNDKLLENAAEIACEIWNEHVTPQQPIELQLKGGYILENTAGRAYQDGNGGCQVIDRSWQVEVNTAYIEQYAKDKNNIVAIVMHEIGHALGIGSDQWRNLFDKNGVIKEKYAEKYPVLKGKELGHDGDHWREKGKLLSEFGEEGHCISPETIAVMELFGHQVRKVPSQRVHVEQLVSQVSVSA